MFALHSLRQGATCSQLRRTAHRLSPLLRRSLNTPARQWRAITKRPPLARPESTAAAKTTKSPAPTLKYPESLNVYRAGTAITLCVGFFRLGGFVIFGIGAFLYAPSFYFSSEHSSLWIPVVWVASAMPLLVLTLTQGPVVHSVRVMLPKSARRSREDLIRFANELPSDTLLQLECIRFSPWPAKRWARLHNLRKIQPSWRVGHSNLEQIPEAMEDGKELKDIWRWLARRWMGLFWISTNQSKNRSSAPGVWEKIWAQIPDTNEKRPVTFKRRSRGPVTMANRPAPETRQGQIIPTKRTGAKR